MVNLISVSYTHLIDLIERELLHKFDILTTIHMDPIDMNDELTNHLREKVKFIVNDINQCYSIHDFRIVSGPTHTNLIFDVLIPADEMCIRDSLFSPSFCLFKITHSFP